MAVRGGLALSAVALVAGLATGTSAGVASAGPKPTARTQSVLSDPTAGHAYRHGAVPLRVPASRFSAANGGGTPSTSVRRTSRAVAGSPLRYGGGSVVSVSPKVYLVFWGSQWGAQSVNGGGYDVYSGDPDGMAPYLQAFFKGLGTDNEQWSAVMTQYCQGVAFGANACPVSPLSSHVAYPSAQVLGGVWEDTSSGLTAATGTQIAQEAANAAVHFSNPAGAQYVIVSPTGTDPDQWLSPVNGYCAYHDHTQDGFPGGVSGPDVPYTNLPYVPDVGTDCTSFNNPAVLDGAGETVSHEYAETLTDPFPSSGWTDRTANENADKCENLIGDSPGGSTHVTLGTGTFAVQGTWANDFGKKGGCENAHVPILTIVPGKQRATQGTPVSLQISASDVRGQSLTYAASGLPGGLAINATTGLISGTPVKHGRATCSVVMSDASASTTISFVWTVRR
jgi:serine protease